jgi:hypothetical protein
MKSLAPLVGRHIQYFSTSKSCVFNVISFGGGSSSTQKASEIHFVKDVHIGHRKVA